MVRLPSTRDVTDKVACLDITVSDSWLRSITGRPIRCQRLRAFRGSKRADFILPSCRSSSRPSFRASISGPLIHTGRSLEDQAS
jgi:hypothetical protein